MARRDARLATIQMADVVLDLAGRERPHGYRCALADRGGRRELPVEKIEWAVGIAAGVQQVEPPPVRRVLALSMATERGAPLYSRADVARLVGVTERTISRWLTAGLNALSRMVPPSAYQGS